MTDRQQDRNCPVTDMVIPPEAVEAAARGMFAEEQCDKRQGQDIEGNWNSRLNDEDHAEYRALATAALEAALPHLRPMLERVVEVHHYDIEKHAESFNEGYDEANRQGIGGEASRNWLTEKVWPLLKDHIEPENSHHVADQIADALLSEADLSDPDTKALVETATRLGRALGRREAGEEMAAAFEAFFPDPHAETEACEDCMVVHEFAAIARNIAAREIATKEDPA